MSDDERWSAALSGRMPADDPSMAGREASLLREALRRWPEPQQAATTATATATATATTDGDGDAAAELLIRRAREEGLFEPRRGWCPSCIERWRRWAGRLRRTGPAGLVLALGLALMLVLPLRHLLQAPPDEPVLRAPADGVVLLRVADPLAARNRLAAELQGAGAQVQRYERLGRQGLDVELPAPMPAALAQRLAQQHLVPAADGSLRVEFEGLRP